DFVQCGNVVLVVEMLKDQTFDPSETPCAGIQVQAVARQSLEEVARELLMDVTRSTEPGQQVLNLLQARQLLPFNESLDAILSRNLQNIVTSLAARRGAVVLIDSKTGKMSLGAVYPHQSEPTPGRVYSQTLAARCLRTGQSLLCADVINDPELLSA